MTLGFKGTWLYVNSAASQSRDRLDDTGTDLAGRVPLSQVVSEARAQGVDVSMANVAGTLLVGRVAIRREIEEMGGYTKQRASQIMRYRQIIDAAPLRIAEQPAYTVEQIRAILVTHNEEARRNKARSPQDR